MLVPWRVTLKKFSLCNLDDSQEPFLEVFKDQVPSRWKDGGPNWFFRAHFVENGVPVALETTELY